ncbi:SRPBCC domain-containing protein [Segetibacter sp. 3557_3]|uniref:SRPBCC domain-containing protein n=1 Tax=Segetibacter sp. 3557_3 TaxID=2547429 RepID=UPI001058FF47|nr:SRPBCC domain-containing protein [Segetibacter sp. 3557_3]TDH24555.1 SRPBCC domain-containing protein [Segetibacter sp. 3557_3]
MLMPDFTTFFTVEQSPLEVFNAITDVRAWWSEDIEGSTKNVNDEFTYWYKDVHICRLKLIAVVPGKRIAWLVLENYFKFTNDPSEWTGNKLLFDITALDNKTQLQFKQLGLVPEYECFKTCSTAWTNYINHSLKRLITTGEGAPNKHESSFNEALLEHHKILKS